MTNRATALPNIGRYQIKEVIRRVPLASKEKGGRWRQQLPL
jgi:hypothetical protein